MDVNEFPYDVPGLWEEYQTYFQKRGISKPNIVLHGNGGKNNMGDDAILEVILRRCLKAFPEARVTVVCYGPGVIQRRYQDLANVDACYFRSWTTLRAIGKSHLYIVAGGGILNRTNVYAGFRRFAMFDPKGKFLYFAVVLAKLFGARTNFYAIGATSFNDPLVKLLARLVIPIADDVSVRDSRSLDNLKGIGITRHIHTVLDPAFSLRPAPRDEALKILQSCGVRKGERPLVGLTLRYVADSEVDNEATIDQAEILVRFLIRDKGCTVLFIPTSQHPRKWVEDDLHLARQLHERLGEQPHFHVVDKFYDPGTMMAILGEMDFSILERLHAMILSSMMGVPLFAVSYDKKVQVFAEIAAREDIPIDPPDVVTMEEFNSGRICSRVESHVDAVLHDWSPKLTE